MKQNDGQICGVDEVGRGCWAGPLVVGAVILDGPLVGLADSKLLSKKTREELASQIWQHAVYAKLGWVSALEVDTYGLTAAMKMGCQRALKDLPEKVKRIVIDGSINYLPALETTKAIIKADQTVPAVSAASIIAKVARDNYMSEQAAIYTDHSFGSHVGYGTAKHKAAILQYGLTPLHRRSYKPIKALL